MRRDRSGRLGRLRDGKGAFGQFAGAVQEQVTADGPDHVVHQGTGGKALEGIAGASDRGGDGRRQTRLPGYRCSRSRPDEAAGMATGKDVVAGFRITGCRGRLLLLHHLAWIIGLLPGAPDAPPDTPRCSLPHTRPAPARPRIEAHPRQPECPGCVANLASARCCSEVSEKARDALIGSLREVPGAEVNGHDPLAEADVRRQLQRARCVTE